MPDLTVWPTDGADGSVSSEARWRAMGRLWIPSGCATPNDLVPTLVAGPTINVTAGACWMDGHFAQLTAPASVNVTANGLLCVRFTPADNHAELLYRDAATVLTQTDPTWELPVARMVAGAIQDIRWIANPSGEVGYVYSPNTAVLSGAHTVTSPLDVVNIPAVYCDGSMLEFVANVVTCGFTTPATGSVIENMDVWQDAATAGLILRCYAPGGPSGYGRTRFAPSAGVHQFRLRGYMINGTAGAFTFTTLRILRV